MRGSASRTTVSDREFRKRNNLLLRDVMHIVELYEGGASYSEIAASCDISPEVAMVAVLRFEDQSNSRENTVEGAS